MVALDVRLMFVIGAYFYTTLGGHRDLLYLSLFLLTTPWFRNKEYQRCMGKTIHSTSMTYSDDLRWRVVRIIILIEDIFIFSLAQIKEQYNVGILYF